MKSLVLLCLAIIILTLSQCKNNIGKIEKSTGYNFKSPDESIELPSVLHEISGLTYIDSINFACIQDENGILFIYDFRDGKIAREFKFFSKGDYEGIARVDDTIYVLRSDGVLFEIADYKSDSIIVIPYQTNIASKDNEGLCYDSENRRLLIACKESTGKGELSKDKRYVFEFNLDSMYLVPDPAFSFDIEKLKEFAKINKVKLPLKGKKKGLSVESVLKFQASEIAIHPLSKKIYILSAEDYMLLVFDKTGKIEQMVMLNHTLFNQPEGITFLENGDMLITNEGPGKGPATLLRFNYHAVRN
jgi:uncharacterized protein YjiK